MNDSQLPAYRTIGVMTCWSTDEAEQMLAFLDDLRADIWVRYGEQIERRRHAAERSDSLIEQQQRLDLDEQPF